MPTMTPAARAAYSFAVREASRLGTAEVEPEHLFLGICKSDVFRAPTSGELLGLTVAERHVLVSEVRGFLSAAEPAGLDTVAARRRLRAICRPADGQSQPFTGHRSRRTREVFDEAQALAGGEITLVALARAVLSLSSPAIDRYLGEQGDLRAKLRRALETPAPSPASAAPAPTRQAVSATDAYPVPEPPPALAHFGRSLTRLAFAGALAPAIGRDDEIKQLARILLQAKKSNPILVGDPGVGKTAIAEGLALRLLDPALPDSLRRLHVFELSLGQLVAGTSHRGEFEERLHRIIEATEADASLVLFVDEVHMLIGAGGGAGAMDAANLLKPALARRAVRLIGATTTAEYRRYIEQDAALERRFQAVWVEEPTRDQTIEILERLRPSLESHHGATILPEAIAKAVDLSIRYLRDFRLPDKAIDIVDRACSRAMLPTVMFGPAAAGRAVPETQEVGVDQVASVVAERCRIPVERLTASEGERLLHMEDDLRRRVIGQDHAITAVADAIRTARAGLKRPNRPVGVFLFLGPTGTGKTELAKALAQFLFEDEARLIRIDMSEYGEEASALKLIGAPPGYVGHDAGGQLTDAVRTYPYSVVLFDEIEKAHPKIFDLFLQVFDDGRLTDGHGRQAVFGETVIVMTSNLGSGRGAPAIPLPIGFVQPTVPAQRPGLSAGVLDEAWAEYERRHREAAAAAFRPELLNRIQRVVCFRPLGPDTIRCIIDKIVNGVSVALADRRIGLVLAPEVYPLLMERGYDPAMGARLMERVIERAIVQPLGRGILEGRYPPGTTVTVEARDGAVLLVTPP